MISNMQYPREMYGKGGLTSLKEARNLLEKYALPGESLAYINDEEAKFLKYMGGAGIPVNSSGVPSYFKKAFKKITKPFAKVLDKIIPNEIKPALPFIAAALPFLAPALAPSIGGFFGATGRLAGAIGSGILNIGAQSAQEGAEKYGINPLSVGLASLGGALATPGAASEFAASRILPTQGVSLEGIDSLSQLGYAPSAIPTPPINLAGIDSLDQLGYNVSGTAMSPQGQLSQLDKLQNIGSTLGEKGATAFDTARSALEPEGAGIFSKEFLTAAVPGQVGAVGDIAYMSAQKALDEYDQQQAALGAMGVANTEGRKAAIRRAMGLAGYTEPEINTTLLKFNFANGGRVGYQMGGASKPPSMPINPDMLAMAIFGKSYDQLTYTQKSAIADMLPNKKAEGGIMDLGGLEMDLRAKGGFVPIGGKEKADDVPARLSKNEFVFTADAVRGAGKGDIKKGAKKMYQLMKQYEAIA
jgi:hypothetical protein